jgi:hypothetical protein
MGTLTLETCSIALICSMLVSDGVVATTSTALVAGS